MLDLVEELLLAALELDALEQPAAHIEAHHLRAIRKREVEALLALREPDAEALRRLLGREIDEHGRVEDLRRVVLGRLRLLDGELRLLRGIVPLEGDGELGMAGAVDPLVEEGVQVAARRLLDGALEVRRGDVAALVLRDVVPDRLPEERIAQLEAEHVQHPGALLVELPVEEVDRLVVDVVHDGPAIALRVLSHVALRVDAHLVAHGVRAAVPLREERVEVGGEALVEPAVGPVATGEQIAEPLVRQLVRDEAIAGVGEVRVGAPVL